MRSSRDLSLIHIFWVPAYWPVTVFQVGIFALAVSALAIFGIRRMRRADLYPLVPLSFAVAWGLLQWGTGHTAYAFDTKTAVVRWATFLAVFLAGISLFRETEVRHWFRSAMLWFGSVVAVVATVQTFTSPGKIFWLFPTEYTDYVMGPILYRNHYAAFIEVVPVSYTHLMPELKAARRPNTVVHQVTFI